MKIIYNNKLKALSRKNRKSGNLSEVLKWEQIKGRKIRGLQFTRQKPILNYIVDFYCPKLQFGIEIDGWTHIDLQKDEIRQKEIESIGIRFIRFLDSDVKNNIENVIEYLEQFIDELIKKQPPNPLC